MLGTIMTNGPGGMETIGVMRVEPLHPDLYTTPATENGVITTGGSLGGYRFSLLLSLMGKSD